MLDVIFDTYFLMRNMYQLGYVFRDWATTITQAGKGMSLGKFGRIAVGWSVITVAGVYAFVLSKNSVEKRRYESMQVRDRMKKSNTGNYQVPDRRFDA